MKWESDASNQIYLPVFHIRSCQPNAWHVLGLLRYYRLAPARDRAPRHNESIFGQNCLWLRLRTLLCPYASIYTAIV
ncbi:hypothetical protein PSPTOT1_3789 [Pseudomonas syringae pv. tomato T1]|nr:hypothetical protein PSPTOT1_3789 [Pseudomonas syringae pv. tomato T1]